ncbi:MAG: YceD family protein [Lachnospiraceae bacterium]
MKVRLSTILTDEKKVIEEVIPFQPEIFEANGEFFKVLSDTAFELTVKNEGNKVLWVKAKGEILIEIPCSRCLDAVPTAFTLDIAQRVDMKIPYEERLLDMDAIHYIDNLDLDFDEMIREEVLTMWPIGVLCKEDCAGICSQCGANHNHTSCNCDVYEAGSIPATLGDLLKNFKEV